jgi:hypothetical protein
MAAMASYMYLDHIYMALKHLTKIAYYNKRLDPILQNTSAYLPTRNHDCRDFCTKSCASPKMASQLEKPLYLSCFTYHII